MGKGARFNGPGIVAGLKKISNLEEVYFQLQAIKKQMAVLENYVLAHLDRGDPGPSEAIMIDPATEKEFKIKQ